MTFQTFIAHKYTREVEATSVKHLHASTYITAASTKPAEKTHKYFTWELDSFFFDGYQRLFIEKQRI